MAGSSKSNVKDFIQWALFGFLIALIVTFLLGRRDRTDRIPTQQPIIKQGNTNSISTLPIISRVQPFALTNQFGNRITDKDLNGTPWLANIIFTRCPTVCPRITQSVSDLLPDLPESLKIVTLTTDPTHDTPEVLDGFARLHGAQTNRWHFLTGDKTELIRLAGTDLKLTALPKPIAEQESPNDLFIHSPLIILVDREGQVRASFEYNLPDLSDRIQNALESLQP